MAARVLVIRHPESAWNRRGIYQGRRDTPLSSLGEMQAQLVAARLSAEPVVGVVSSPLRRAIHLAAAIAQPHGVPVQADARLTEIAHGTWEGLPRQTVQRRFPETFQTWTERPHDVTFPGGESLADVHDRAVTVVAELLLRPQGELWVVVTHDTVARLVVAAARDQPVVGFSSVSLENGAITYLEGPRLVGSLRRLNDTAHLLKHRVDLRGQAL